ncbi:sensor histidine kinase [Plantactinospora solaniradicis]|uniref:histidine kinase n=1 Tax=Plantactinospora solaniradicis TaxID=1723736 RepID=A0ABW1K1Y2_9ACTN
MRRPRPRRYGGAVVLWRWALIGVDALVAAGVVAAVVLMRPVSGGWVWCLAALLGLPLAVRRCWPVPVLGVVLAAAGTTLIVGVGTEVMVYAVAFALYPVALSSARAASWGFAGALAAVLVPGLVDALVAGIPVVPARDGVESFTTTPVTVAAYSTAVIAGSWALAWALRTRRGHAVQLTELHTARAVAEERLRIARDVHDVVGHNLSLIAMKSAVANHLDADPQAALRTIEQVSRAALDDVRAVLGGLRDTGGPPDTADLDRLVEQTRAAGIAVAIDRADLSSAPAGVRVSTHRILQEALTNVRRHAGATHCRVTVTVAPDTLSLTVLDNGAAPREANPPGHGLLGMHERVAVHGGSLSAGPEPGGGFAVRATLPFPT